jgi:hypothetical protein
MFSWEYNRNF